MVGVKRVVRRRANEYQWIVEELETRSTFTAKAMMGCELIGLNGLQRLVLADKAEPWRGLLVCTNRDQHESLCREFKSLRPHPVLGKWLYLSAACDDFESTALALADLVLRADSRIGVESKPRKRAAVGARARRVK